MAPSSGTGGDRPTLTRREAVCRLTGVLCAPLIAGGCRRDASEEARTSVDAAGDEPAGPARVELPADEPTVRVRVRRSRAPATVLALGEPDQWIRVEPVGAAEQAVVLRGPLSLRRKDSGWMLADQHGAATEAPDAAALELTSIDPRHPNLRLGDSTYPGSLRAVPRPSEGTAAFDVVNHVALEAYLPGVLARELFSNWHLETHMAQAVAARSFACTEHAYFRDRRHYDLTSTTRSQVYVGHVTHHRAVDGVAMTRGAVLEFERGVVPGYYCSCCGGLPAAASDAIGSNPINRIGPLRGQGAEVACAESPVYDWTLELPLRPLTEGLSLWGKRRGVAGLKGLRRLEAVVVAERNPHGRPIRHELRGVGGTSVILDAERLRQAVNEVASTVLRGSQRLRSSSIEATVEGSTVSFAGRGFGHGVGMCQYGAEARARGGQDHVEILEWYYPGAAVLRAYT